MVYYNSPTMVRELSQRTVRRPVARVRVEWTGTLLDIMLAADSDDRNRVTYINQVYDAVKWVKYKWLCVNDYSRLDDDFHPMPDNGDDPSLQVGWRGNIAGDNNGAYADGTPRMTVVFSPRNMNNIVVVGDNRLGEYPLEFSISVFSGDTQLADVAITPGSNLATLDVAACEWNINFSTSYINADKVVITVLKWNRPNTFVKIVEAYVGVESEYTASEIVSLSLLEETESSGGTLPVGNISCNEMDLTLQNIDNKYFPFNDESDVHSHLTRNRKIVPYFGFIDSDGNEHLVPKGLYWSGEWNVSEQDTGASTSALDRMAQFQDIEYVGFFAEDGVDADGFCTIDNQDAEYTYWLDITPHDLIVRLLEHIRQTVMPDLEFDIDANLANFIIPVAFFAEQSYFDIIKSIAQVSMAYAYMDTPTDVEVAVAAELGNVGLRDILRIRDVREALMGNAANDITISARDYLTRTHPENAAELANEATVLWHKYRPVDGKPEEAEDSPQRKTASSFSSIERLGIAKYEYPDNNLIQDEAFAENIAGAIIDMFSETHRTQTLQTFGDPSMSILDRAKIPEFQKFFPREKRVDVLRLGAYTIKRIQTEYDGSLRQNIECRRLDDALDIDEINETGVAVREIDESGTRADNIYETGRVGL